eukprot:2455387-Rhodomonas_salina.1
MARGESVGDAGQAEAEGAAGALELLRELQRPVPRGAAEAGGPEEQVEGVEARAAEEARGVQGEQPEDGALRGPLRLLHALLEHQAAVRQRAPLQHQHRAHPPH